MLRHQVYELPPIKLNITEYQLEKGTCVCCGKKRLASLPRGITWGITGPRLTSFMSHMLSKYKLSRRGLQSFLSEQFSFTLSMGCIYKKQHLVSDALKEPVADLFELWHQYKQGCFSRWEFIRKTQLIRQKVGELLEQGTYTDPKLRIVRFCSNLLTHFDALWTFIFNDNIEPTNNHAEQCLRPAVIWRKNYFGTRSDYGSDFVARTMSLITSCRLQAKSAFDVCSQILMDHCSGKKSMVFANPL